MILPLSGWWRWVFSVDLWSLLAAAGALCGLILLWRWPRRAGPGRRGCDHQWDQTMATVMAGRPLLVEYRCRRCGLWTLEQEDRRW